MREIATIIQEIRFRPAICLTVHIWPERAEVWPVAANLQARNRTQPPSNPVTQLRLRSNGRIIGSSDAPLHPAQEAHAATRPNS